jgi:hypothetical protein
MADVNPLKVEKLPVEVTMIMLGGEELTGTIYLDMHSRHHAGPERMEDVLNSQTRFIPLMLPDGRMVLLNRLRIITGHCRQRVADEYEEMTRELLTDHAVTIRLSDGRTINGAIRTDLPKEHARLSDLLNHPEDFVRVIDGEIEYFVNRAYATWFLEG